MALFIAPITLRHHLNLWGFSAVSVVFGLIVAMQTAVLLGIAYLSAGIFSANIDTVEEELDSQVTAW